MARIEGVCREVTGKSGRVAIAAIGADMPHLAASRTRNDLAMTTDRERIPFPAWHYEDPASNLKRDPRGEAIFITCDLPRREAHAQQDGWSPVSPSRPGTVEGEVPNASSIPTVPHHLKFSQTPACRFAFPRTNPFPPLIFD